MFVGSKSLHGRRTVIFVMHECLGVLDAVARDDTEKPLKGDYHGERDHHCFRNIPFSRPDITVMADWP